jgi:hypothetical protein
MKKYLVNMKDEHRTIHSRVELDKKQKVKLYWFCDPVDGDNSPLKFVKAQDRAGFGESGALKFSMNTDKNGVCEHDEFKLSACGKDKYKVSVGIKSDGSDKKTAEEYEVWRRVFFSVRYMDAKFLLSFDPVHAEYKKHGIWPEQIAPAGGSAKVAYHDAITSYEMGYTLVQAVTESRLEARIVLVDRIWLAHKREFIVKTKHRRFRVNTFPQTGDEATSVDPGWMLWTGSKFGTGTVGGVGIGNYDFTPHLTRLGDRELRVAIPDGTPMATALDEAAGRGKLVYKFTVWFADVLNGFANSATGRILIANRGSGSSSRPLAPRQGTVIHEMGHGLGMVPAKIQEYNEFNGNPIKSGLKKNPTQYQNGGGHCNTNAGGSDPNFTSGSCVMFHYGHNARTLEFCPSCAPIVKRLNMNRSGMRWPEKGG